MKKILILSSDTAHHRYFINSFLKNDIQLAGCLFETEHVKPMFPIDPLFEKDENKFEESHFFTEVDENIPESLVTAVNTVNSAPAVEQLAGVKPDFGIVFGTGKIHKNVINLFSDGLLNVHRGITQEYRGLDSDLWAIYHSDYKNIGVTIHRVDPVLDTGDIVYQARMPIKPQMKIHQIRYYTTLIATELMLRAVFDYLEDRIEYKSQDKNKRYYSFMPLELKKIVQKKFNCYCEKYIESPL